MRHPLLALALTCAATPAFAQPAPLANDPKRPTAAIAHDLGVTQDQFVACFDNVRPAGAGTRPTAERTQANKAVLLPCLHLTRCSK
jgi:hypothetical protein